MHKRTPLLIRGLATGVMAIGLLGATVLPVAAQEICREEPFLAAVDGNGDGVVSTAEIRSVHPDNARLQELAGQLEAAGVTGIRYTGCDDGTGNGSGSGTGTGNGADASGSGTNGSATGDGGATSANATGAGGSTGTSASGAGGGDTTESTDDVVITDMPSVGQGASTVSGWDATMVTLIVGAASIMTLGAALTLRRRSLT